MTIKEQIKSLFSGKKVLTLQEIYKMLPLTRSTIRSTLNYCVKNNDTFVRVGNGQYSLIKTKKPINSDVKLEVLTNEIKQ